MPHPVMTMLECGVPPSLLLDLLPPDGPDSKVIYLLEQPRTPSAPVPTGPGAA
jgi:hypothetical protein